MKGAFRVAPLVTRRVRTEGCMQAGNTVYTYEDQQFDKDLSVSELNAMKEQLPKWDGNRDPTPLCDGGPLRSVLQHSYNLTNKDCCRILCLVYR